MICAQPIIASSRRVEYVALSASMKQGNFGYWFKRDTPITAADCVLLAVLDSSNCRTPEKPLRSLCKTTIIRIQITNAEDIWSLIKSNALKESSVKRLNQRNIDPYIQTRPKTRFTKRYPLNDFESVSDDESILDNYCPFHYRIFDAWKDNEVWNEYRRCWKYTRHQLLNTPRVILGQEMYVNEKSILLKGDKVYFLGNSDTPSIPPRNFAASWADLMPATWLLLKRGSAPELLLPPVLFHEFEAGYHVVIDLFGMIGWSKVGSVKAGDDESDEDSG
ncbi:hypothetical protein BJX70DRAFT_395067 [Aspergillus crustosus]